MTLDKLKGCLVAGAIGDAIGSFYENQPSVPIISIDIDWNITDDTQLTLATCESIIEQQSVSAEAIAQKFLQWYNGRKLTGLGASTLKALRDLQMGAHWALSGRSGEYAAGNGAAMRIAPLAFFLSPTTDRTLIKDVCNITHKNDEAYTGALAVLYALQTILENKWINENELIGNILANIPDMLVKDKLIQLHQQPDLTIKEAAKLIGSSGFVAESIPLSIFAAQKIRNLDFKSILQQLIQCGGDTDTNCSIAGQIIGTHLGYSHLPPDLLVKFDELKEKDVILTTADLLSRISS